MLKPSWGKKNSRFSKLHPEPNVFVVTHWVSRTFTTNQPSLAGASPESESSRRASGTARESTGDGPPRRLVERVAEHLGRHRVAEDDRIRLDERADRLPVLPECLAALVPVRGLPVDPRLVQ